MSIRSSRHNLEGLEPDNLLAFLALLGLLRALEAARPRWHPRAAWDPEQMPLRPFLTTAEPATRLEICAAAAEGVAALVMGLDFAPAAELKLSPAEARELLCRAATGENNDKDRYFSDLCSALLSDAALARDRSATAPTPLSYPKVARINFLAGLEVILRVELPEQKGRARDAKYPKHAADCIAQALFDVWERLDRPPGLRWDPDEAKRHAYQWNAPTDEQPKTQHGANRLAIIGLSGLTAAPVMSGSEIRLSVIGGEYARGEFSFAWPIWREPASFVAIRALLSHPQLREPKALDHLGIFQVCVTRRISLDRYRNFTLAEPIEETGRRE